MFLYRSVSLVNCLHVLSQSTKNPAFPTAELSMSDTNTTQLPSLPDRILMQILFEVPH